MPNFPTYPGELPPYLNPWKPRHYFLLAYWVFFRPTALKCYLYQADPELYKTGVGLGIFRTLGVRAYRNLYLMMPVIVLFFSLIITTPFSLIDYFVLGIPVNIFEWMFKITRGVAVGVAYGVAVSVAFGVAVGVAVGVAAGVAAGVAIGVTDVAFSGVATKGLESAAFGVLGGVAFGVLGGVAFGVAIGVAIGVVGVVKGVALGVVGGVALGMGASRAIFYPIQWLLSLLNISGKVKHPLLCDEFMVLPLPYIRHSLEQTLRQNEQKGLCQLAEIMSNPFQRWLMQKILYNYLHEQKQPLDFTYNRILGNAALNTYVFAPVDPKDWERMPNHRQLLLGELAGKWLDIFNFPLSNASEKLVWWLTNPFRERRSTPLTQFAALLYALYKIDRESPADILNQTWAKDAYTHINPYPNGKEIRQSFAAFAAFLNYQNLTDLINAQHLTADLPDTHTAIRPTVLIALTRLGDIGAEIATYKDSTSRVNKLSALARAAESLEQLKTYANTEINEPERYIFVAIIEQWQPLITAASGEIGRFTLTEPIQNPYIVGNPVKPPIFVGREDIFRQLEALWQPKECPSVVLYGHRRIGKTSILKNLGAQFGTQSQIIDFNMQRVGFVKNIGELLYNLAINIYDELPNPTITEPEETRFLTSNPYTTFDRFLKKLDKLPHKKRLLITIDEFELIEKAINEKRIEPYLLEYLRGLIHTYPWFIIALAGLHTLEEMCHDYWNPLFLTVKPILVSFLSDGATHQLITAPEPDFPLEYEKAAIEKIIQVTYNQPYLVQHICHGLVERFNTQTFEKGKEQTRQFTRADVTQVIDSKSFFTNAHAYFNGVWAQADVDDKQPIILKILAPMPNGLTLSELATQTKLSENALAEALKILQNHDIIKREGDRFTYTVALMQRWVREKSTAD